MAETFRNYREESKKQIGGNVEEKYRACDDQIKLGAILRIADATEKMASSYDDLKRERDYYQRLYQEKTNDKKILKHRIAGLKGYIGRLKRK